MATVVTGLACSLSLQSAAYLQGLNAAAMATTTAAGRMQRAFGQATVAANATTTAVQRQAAAANKTGQSLAQIGRSVTAVANSWRTLRSLFAIGLIVEGVEALASYSDAWQTAGNKIAAAAEISGRSARSLSELNKIAADTRSPLEDIGDLYAKLLRTTANVANSEMEVAQATETVAQAFKAGGASTLEQVNGIRQLAQALGSGILQGDELRSIRENAPLLAKAIADELGTTVAGLKQIGAQGKITSDVIFDAIKRSRGEIFAAFSETTATVQDSNTVLENSFMELVGSLNAATGASKKYHSFTEFLSGALREMASNIAPAAEALKSFGVETATTLGRLPDLFDEITVSGDAGVQTLMAYAGALRGILDATKGLQAANPEELFKFGLADKSHGMGLYGPEQGLDYKGIAKNAADKLNKDSDPSAAIKAANKALEEHRALINDVGSAYEKYQVALDEIKDKHYSAADAARANSHAEFEYRNNLDKEAEAIGLTLTPMQEYEAALRKIADAEENGRATSEQAFAARAVAVANFASSYLAAFGALTGALSQLFKENKAIAIANAIISTAEGIANSLKLLPSPLAWVYAAAAAVTGAAQIATIMSTQPGSSKKPSIGSGAKGGTTASAPVEAGDASSSSGSATSVNITIQGEGGFTNEQVRDLITQINSAVGDGAELKATVR